MPQVANLVKNEVRSDNNIFTSIQSTSDPVTQKPTNNNFSFRPVSLNNVGIQKNTIAILSGD
ncbi:hypothetical protein J6P59_06940 [bacterium]|nr:hypothetical protein [bacterium]MBO6073308.1 hypothetical protein [bacterium]